MEYLPLKVSESIKCISDILEKNLLTEAFLKCKIVVLSLVSVVLSSKLKTIFSWASKMVWWEGCLLPSLRTWVWEWWKERTDFQKLSPELHTCTNVPPNTFFIPLSPSRWYKCSNTLSQSAPAVAFPHTVPLTIPLSVLSSNQNFHEIVVFSHQAGLRISSTLNPAQRQCLVECAVHCVLCWEVFVLLFPLSEMRLLADCLTGCSLPATVAR